MITINGYVSGQKFGLYRTVSATGMTAGQLKIEFSEEWKGYAKTAIFFQDKENPYRVLFNDEDNTVQIPREAILDSGIVHIGIFGVANNQVLTTEIIGYNFRDGAISNDITSPDPTLDIYEQIMNAYVELSLKLDHLLAEPTANQEMIDARTGENGVTYDTIGEAIRGQFSEVNNSIQGLRQEVETAPDTTLAVSGQAADAKATGDAIKNVKDAIPGIDAKLTASGKAADAKATGDAINSVKAAIPSLDTKLTTSGQAADSKAVGDKFTEVNTSIENVKKTISGMGAIGVDAALETSGAAADAKVTGEKFSAIDSTVESLNSSLTQTDASLTQANASLAQIKTDMIDPVKENMIQDGTRFSHIKADNPSFLDCAMTWYKNRDKLVVDYGITPNTVVYTDGAWSRITSPADSLSSDGKGGIDCQSFVSMVLAGIGYEESIYGDCTNESKYPSFNIPWLSPNLMKYSGVVKSGVYTPPTLTNGTKARLLSWQMCWWFRNLGLAEPVTSIDDLHIGDLLYYDFHGDGIEHVAIFLGKIRDLMTVIEANNEAAEEPVTIRTRTTTGLKYYVNLGNLQEYKNGKTEKNLLMNRYSTSPNGANGDLSLFRNISTNDILKCKFRVSVPSSYSDGVWLGVIVDGNQYNRIKIYPSDDIIDVTVFFDPESHEIATPSNILRYKVTSDGTAAVNDVAVFPVSVCGLYMNDETDYRYVATQYESGNTDARTELATKIADIAFNHSVNRDAFELDVVFGANSFTYGKALIRRYTSTICYAIVTSYQDNFMIAYSGGTPTFTSIESADVIKYLW